MWCGGRFGAGHRRPGSPGGPIASAIGTRTALGIAVPTFRRSLGGQGTRTGQAHLPHVLQRSQNPATWERRHRNQPNRDAFCVRHDRDGLLSAILKGIRNLRGQGEGSVRVYPWVGVSRCTRKTGSNRHGPGSTQVSPVRWNLRGRGHQRARAAAAGPHVARPQAARGRA